MYKHFKNAFQTKWYFCIYFTSKTINLKIKATPEQTGARAPKTTNFDRHSPAWAQQQSAMRATRVGLGLDCPKAQSGKTLGPTHCNLYDSRPASSFLFPMWDINSLGPYETIILYPVLTKCRSVFSSGSSNSKHEVF